MKFLRAINRTGWQLQWGTWEFVFIHLHPDERHDLSGRHIAVSANPDGSFKAEGTFRWVRMGKRQVGLTRYHP